MSTRPCPHCGASRPDQGRPDQGRFCGQCGATLAPSGPSPSPSSTANPTALPARTVAPPKLYQPDVHEEVTVARDLPEIAELLSASMALGETASDVSPFGATEEAPAKNPAPAPAGPRPGLNKTILMGADTAAAPHAGGGAAPSRSDRPTAPPDVAEAGPPRHDASPLSRSVAVPLTWTAPEAARGVARSPEEGAEPQGVDVARVVSVGEPSPEPEPEPAPRPSARPVQGAPALRTMMGMPASALPPAAGAAANAERPAAPPPNVAKTMMGIAIPGIAPLQAGPAAPPAPGAAAPPNAGDLRSQHSTMLGVAIPGIAPTQPNPVHGPHGPHGGPHAAAPPYIPSQVQNTSLGTLNAADLPLVPRPKTLIDEPLPPALVMPPKRGVPALVVVGILIGVVTVLGGIGAFFALRARAPLTAIPQLDENGRESLRIGCVSCPDGTTVALGASTATVTASAAVLPLPAPLSIGENDLGVKIDRPGAGRDEQVNVHVPVAYRVRADLSTLEARPPAITVRVEATAGSEVKVDDHPVTLDATGRGAYAIDLAQETEGTGEARAFERKIPFVITPRGGKAESGQLTARTAILALGLDAPGSQLFTEQATAAVTGQTRPGAKVTIDGQHVAVDAEGRFGVRVELSSVGDKPLEIMASAPPQAPRIAKVHVVRVASLEAAARNLEAEAPLTFEAFGADPASRAGQKAVVEGNVVEIRAAGGHTVMLVETTRGCAKGATCLVRVVHGEEDKVARGGLVRAYGRILGAVTASGKTVPDLEASLVLPIKAPR